jgi:hypothetical protein
MDALLEEEEAILRELEESKFIHGACTMTLSDSSLIVSFFLH